MFLNQLNVSFDCYVQLVILEKKQLYFKNNKSVKSSTLIPFLVPTQFTV